jgi:hypothetical protein
VGTPLALRAGRYTGACEIPVCQGPGKASRLEAYLGDAQPFRHERVVHPFLDLLVEIQQLVDESLLPSSEFHRQVGADWKCQLPSLLIRRAHRAVPYRSNIATSVH